MKIHGESDRFINLKEHNDNLSTVQGFVQYIQSQSSKSSNLFEHTWMPEIQSVKNTEIVLYCFKVFMQTFYLWHQKKKKNFLRVISFDKKAAVHFTKKYLFFNNEETLTDRTVWWFNGGIWWNRLIIISW